MGAFFLEEKFTLAIKNPEHLSAWLQTKEDDSLYSVIPHFLLRFLSIHTRKNYLKDLKNFFSFLKTAQGKIIHHLSEVHEQDVGLWKTYLVEQGLSPASVRRKLHTLSSLFAFAIRRNFVQENPVVFVQKPRLSAQKGAVILNEEQVQKIFDHLKASFSKATDGKTFQDLISLNPVEFPLTLEAKTLLLWYSVLGLLFSVGLRVQELCSLRMTDVIGHQDYGKIQILQAKGGVLHTPVISKSVLEMLHTYQRWSRFAASFEEPLFVATRLTHTCQPLSPRAVYDMVSKSAQRAGLDVVLSPHSCRATLATLLHKKKVPIKDIQNLLNHKDIQTTSVYIRKLEEVEESASLKTDFLQFS